MPVGWRAQGNLTNPGLCETGVSDRITLIARSCVVLQSDCASKIRLRLRNKPQTYWIPHVFRHKEKVTGLLLTVSEGLRVTGKSDNSTIDPTGQMMT